MPACQSRVDVSYLVPILCPHINFECSCTPRLWTNTQVGAPHSCTRRSIMTAATRKRSRSLSLSTSGSTRGSSPPPTVQAKRFKLEGDDTAENLTLEATPDVLRWLSDLLPKSAPGYPVNLPEFQKVPQGKFTFRPEADKAPYRPLATADIRKAEKRLADFELHRSDAGSVLSVPRTSSEKDDASSASGIDDKKSTSELETSDQVSEATQTSAGVAEARLQLRHSYPPILFSHHNQAAKGTLPLGVKELLKRTCPDNLAQGCLPTCIKNDLEEEYPDTALPNWVFSEADSVDSNTKSLLLQVKRIVQMSTDLLILNADEQPWGELVNCILNGVVRKQLFERPIRKLQVKRMYMHMGEESYFEAAYLDNVLDIEVDFMLEANALYPDSPLRKLKEKPLADRIPEDFNLSPLWDPLSQHSPAFAVVKATCQAGNWQDAQMHAGMGAVAILEKARSLGASRERLPCVPAIVVIGHRWELNLIYEDNRGNYIVGGPWSIGGSNSFMEALKLVLVIEELWKYGGEEWWSVMVESVAVKAYQKYTTPG
ncbi:hypothetical protein TWF481_002347 [Arthrobotrys musiformis]|uniref:PD-(D/E)XK nuclease-like domain-containing protein n=1 Tax=Arthrobotrys musiformis TaxID=47236 RepID=A0AAV9VUJ9_9PEZI